MTLKFSEFLRKNPIKKPGIVAVMGKFDPPALGHETVFNEAANLANRNGYPMRIYIHNQKDSILEQADRKAFCKSIFPRYKHYFIEKKLSDSAFFEQLNSEYNKIILVSANFPDRKINETYELWSSGDRDPESDSCTVVSSSQMVEYAKINDIDSFRSNLPSSTSYNLSKRLFESIRSGIGLTKREPVIFERETTREEFYNGILKEGQRVMTKELNEGVIKSIGANFVIVEVDGKEKRYWPKDLIKL